MAGLIGFDEDQFRQVVMLPQGQFRQLLTANSKDREEILAVLFGADRYAALQDFMKAQADEVDKAARALLSQERMLLEQAGVESAPALGERLTEARAEAVAAASRIEALDTAVEAARRAREAGQAAQGKLDALAEAEAALAGLAAGLPRLEADERRLASARRAARLASEQARLDEAADRAERAATALAKAEKDVAEAEAGVEAAAARLEEAKAAAPQLEAAREEVNQLTKLELELAEAYGALAEAARLRGEAEEAAREAARLAQEQERLAAEVTTAEALVQDARQAKLALPGLEAVSQERERVLRARRQLVLDEGVLREEEQALARQDALMTTSARKAATLRQALEAVERRFVQGQAARLAAGLQAGEPCPVCGSTEHPLPATSDEPPPEETVLRGRARAARPGRAGRAAAGGGAGARRGAAQGAGAEGRPGPPRSG